MIDCNGDELAFIPANSIRDRMESNEVAVLCQEFKIVIRLLYWLTESFFYIIKRGFEADSVVKMGFF